VQLPSGHGKKVGFFANHSLVDTSIISKKMHKLKIKSIHSINKSNHQINNPPPISDDERRRTPPTSGDFSGEKKKKRKIDLATGGGRDLPHRPGGEIWPPSVASLVNQPRKKKFPVNQKKSSEPKKLFLMPQKSILMPQTRF
jgi:hypothetical protein